MRLIAKLVSALFHPVFILYYIFLTLHIITPVAFIYSDPKQGLAVHFLVFGMSVFFPLVSTFALRAAGLIKSVHLEEKQDRIGPMIATIIFYVWLFLNYRSFNIGPNIFDATILGATIALSICFLINNFSKISMHGAGMGGLVGAFGIFRMTIPQMTYDFPIDNFILSISPNLFLALAIILAGVVGSARLELGSHRPQDVYGGFIIGLTTQIMAYWMLGPL